mmetsp:Transcript_378/g.512  ORF Transcript_378/g.512 Transcript_378/m.512 type:complete len:163 (+) Transcript_378:3-491(+)
MIHWEQGLSDNSFRWFDYGSTSANMQKYGQGSPPMFNLSDVAVPVALFTGENDYMVQSADLTRLIAELPPHILIKHDHIPTFSHLDFTWAPDANHFVYPSLVATIARYMQVGEEYLMPANSSLRQPFFVSSTEITSEVVAADSHSEEEIDFLAQSPVGANGL